MASILQVEQIKGPTSGASANKITIPSGQTLAIDGTIGGTASIPAARLSGTLPAIDGSNLTGMNIGYGAFRATFLSGITISNTTFTKLAFSVEDYDYDNVYDNSNYRYTPQVAGLYSISCFVQVQGWISTSTSGQLRIYKNGSYIKGKTFVPNTSEYPSWDINSFVYLNGSTDYVEMYIYHAAGLNRDFYANKEGGFEGFLVRAD